MNGRRPRLNGRTMNETNSIGAISSVSDERRALAARTAMKKCSPCFQKPTPSTIAKLMIDIVPVTVNWLVTVNGCAPGTIAERHRADPVGERMNMKAVNTHGRYLRPSGPIDCAGDVVDEAGQHLDRGLPAAGHQLALEPAPHEHHDHSQDDQHPQRRIGEHGTASPPAAPPPIGEIMNWCIGSILAGPATCSSFLSR